MRIPTIHLNGTSPDVLLKQCDTVGKALREAMDALESAAPHPRDFYVQGDNAFNEALSEYSHRKATLQQILKDYQAMHLGLRQQQDARYKR